MKATMIHPEANNLSVFKLRAKDLEKVSGGGRAEKYRDFIIYGLTWATLTLYGYEFVPETFEEYFNHMIANEASVLIIMYNSIEPDVRVPISASEVRDTYKNMGMSEKKEILRTVYHKFK